MKVQRGRNLVLFFKLLVDAEIIFLGSLTFFLGFDATKANFLIFLTIILVIIIWGWLIFLFYALCYRVYYEFNNEGIYLIKRNNKQKIVEYNKIISAEYYRVYHLLLGNSSGGILRVIFLHNGKMMYKDIAISLKQLRRLLLHKVVVK